MARKTSQKTPSPENQQEPAKAEAAPAEKAGPTREQIARRAYEIYLARGGQHGQHEDDWRQAERELRLGRQ